MQTAIGAPPERSLFTTRDPDEAHAFTQALYTANRMRIRGPREHFRMRHTLVRADRLVLAGLQHSMSVRHDVQPTGGIAVARVLGGTVERSTDGVHERFRPGDVFVLANPEHRHTICWDDLELQIVGIDLGSLAELAGVDTDDAPCADQVRFTDLQAVSPGRARHWRATVDYVAASVLRDEQALSSPIIVGSAVRLLAAATLTTFANTGTPHETRWADATPAVVRRAVDLIEDRAHVDLGVAQIAAAARVSTGTLREAFRLHLGTTPSAYLRRVRLEGAHEQLLYSSVGSASIREVAMRWGFTDLRRFSQAYRVAYGRRPEDILTGSAR